MFIKQHDYEYLVALYESLDTEMRKRFLTAFLREIGAKAGEELRQAIRVVTEQILDKQAIAPAEWVTRTMIKKVYKEVKGRQA